MEQIHKVTEADIINHVKKNTPNSPKIFKVFNGSQSGFQCSIDYGFDLTIGSEFGSHIYYDFLDRNAKLKLQILNNEIIFKELPTNMVFHNDDAIELGKKYPLPVFLNVGIDQIAIGTKDKIKEWPVNLIDMAMNESVIIEQPEEKPRTKLKQLYEYLSFYYLVVEKNLAPYLLSIKSLILNRYRKNKRNFLITTVSCSLLIMLSIFILRVELLNNAETQTIKNTHLIENKIRAEFAKIHLQYPNLYLVYNTTNQYSINGVVETTKDLQNITKAFKLYQNVLDLHVYVISDMITQINTILQAAQIGKLIARFDEVNSIVSVSGVTNQLMKLNDVLVTINNKFPDIGNIDTSQVYDYNQLNNDLNAALANYHSLIIEHNLKINNTSLSNWQIQISGYLTTDDQNNINDIANKFMQKYPIISIKNNFRDLMSMLPFNISEVYTGNPAYIKTSTGKKLYVGDYESGFQIITIDNSEVVLAGKLHLSIPINSLSDSIASTNNSQIITSNNNIKINDRSAIITEDLNQEQESLAKDQQYLKKLNQLKINVNDKNLLTNINQQISNVMEDINLKQHNIKADSKLL